MAGVATSQEPFNDWIFVEIRDVVVIGSRVGRAVCGKIGRGAISSTSLHRAPSRICTDKEVGYNNLNYLLMK